MAKNNISKKVLLKHVRLSFPALDAPRQGLNPGDEPKYEASFLLNPADNAEDIKNLKQAIKDVAEQAFGDAARSVLAGATSQPLHSGDEKAYAGYAGNLYVKARSKLKPYLFDANPKHQLVTAEEIKEKLVPGYYVNASINVFSYTYPRRGISCSLNGVQFARIGETFGGIAISADDFQDETAGADAASAAALNDILGEDTPF